jgi:putative phosphonate metabolism protein
MRYAVYFAPAAGSALHRFGAAVIGYDADTGRDLAQLAPAGVADWPAATAEPRRYGFHATLKAPFRLAAGLDAPDLVAAVAAFAAERAPVRLAGLAVAAIGPFCALTPLGDVTALQRLASDVVLAFEPFRAALTEADRARRLQSPLTPRQIGYLDTFGYPYVHEDFRFHMTLTGPLHVDLRDRVRDGLATLHAEAVPAGPVVVDQLAVFRQATPAERFRIVFRAALGGAA